MATGVETSKRLVLYYEKGSFSFGKIDIAAGDQGMYDLAHALNYFQDEKPPKKIVSVATTQII
ncbi:MAG: hypothetical protein FWF03_06025 [Defluviitaleaceae bacterium]|nr:hypothetical protein [Defluviitaleaceae bacterium]